MAANPTMAGSTMTADGTFSAGTTPVVAIVAAGDGRRIFRVQNTHASQTLYLGPTDAVSSSAYSWKLIAGATLDLDGYSGALYCVGSGTATTGVYLKVTA